MNKIRLPSYVKKVISGTRTMGPAHGAIASFLIEDNSGKLKLLWYHVATTTKEIKTPGFFTANKYEYMSSWTLTEELDVTKD